MMTALHVLAGTIVLIVAPAALLMRKGGPAHRAWGKAFAVAMGVVLFSAGFMWQPKGHLFLFALSLVSAYLIFTGFRVLARRRRPRTDAIEDGVDALGAAAACVAGLVLLAIALGPRDALMRSLAPIVATLGAIALAFALNDVRGITGRPSRVGLLIVHLSAMTAAYVSAVTAFVVINVHGVPMALRWIVPSALGSTVIAVYSMRYRRRRAPAAAPLPPAAEVASLAVER